MTPLMLALEEQSLKERQPTGQKGPAVGMAGCQEVLGRAWTSEPSQLPGPGLGRGSVGGEDKSWWASQGGAIGPEVGTVPLRAALTVGVPPLTPS